MQAVSVADAIADKELVKKNVDGLEADLLTSLDASHFASLDMVCEVGTPEGAEIIWNPFKDSGVNLFSQKSGWARVTNVDGMSRSY